MHLAFCTALLLLALSLPTSGHNGEQTAYAIPLDGITIDGWLDDWPERMAVYPIAWVSPTAYKPDPPEGPADLTASFRVGYDAGANLLYVAVVARDDDWVIDAEAGSYYNQDLTEIYIDADHSGGDAASRQLQGAKDAQQYVMVAGPSRFHDVRLVNDSPALAAGDTRISGVRAAFLRVGEYTVYEWAIPLWSSFPEQRYSIEPGATIGFDAVVTDADGEEVGNWVAWTPGAGKSSDSNRYGDLTFVHTYTEVAEARAPTAPPVDYGALGTAFVHLIQSGTGAPLAGAQVQLLQDGQALQSGHTDAEGRCRLVVPPGIYALQFSLSGVEGGVAGAAIEVREGAETAQVLEVDVGWLALAITDGGSGRSLAGADGTLLVDALAVRKVRTDAAGAALLQVPPGSYGLRIEAIEGWREFAPRTVQVRGGETTAVAIIGVDYGTRFHVDDDAVGDGDGSAERPFRRIAEALLVSGTGDTVQVAAGTYRESVAMRSGIALLGAGADSTILDGEGRRNLVQIISVEDVVVQGFALVNGRSVRQTTVGGYYPRSAGVHISGSRRVRVVDNLISGNISSGDEPVGNGGGIYVQNGDSTVVIEGNLVVGNRASGEGGGISVVGSARLLGNTVVYNQAARGGGIFLGGAAALRENIVAYNAGGGILSAQSDELPVLSDNTVWHNTRYDYSGVAPGAGDTSVEPSFAAAVAGDFRLSRGGRASSRGSGVGPSFFSVPPPARVEALAAYGFSAVGPAVAGAERIVLLPPVRLRVDTLQIGVDTLEVAALGWEQSSPVPGFDTFASVAVDSADRVWTLAPGVVRMYDGLWTQWDTLDGVPAGQDYDKNAALPRILAAAGGIVVHAEGEVALLGTEGWEGIDELGEANRLLAGRGGKLWLATSESAASFDTVLTHLAFVDSAGQPWPQAQPLVVEPGGAVWWLLGRGSGDVHQNLLVRADDDAQQAFSLPFTIPMSWPGYAVGHQPCIVSAAGQLWCGLGERVGNGGGSSLLLQSILQLDPATARMRLHQLPADWIFHRRSWDGADLHEDAAGRLWVIGGGRVLQYADGCWRGAQGLDFLNRGFAVDRQGAFWFANETPLTRWGPPVGSQPVQRLAGQQVTCLAEDGQGTIWFGTTEGLQRRAVDGTWSADAQIRSLVLALHHDGQDRLWAATDGGLYQRRGSRWVAQAGLEGQGVIALAEEVGGDLWAAAKEGLYTYEGERWVRRWPDAATRSEAGADLHAGVYNLYADDQGRLWFHTYHGLYAHHEGVVRDFVGHFYPRRRQVLDSLLVLTDSLAVERGIKEQVADETMLGFFLNWARPFKHRSREIPAGLRRFAVAYQRLVDADAEFAALARRTQEAGWIPAKSWEKEELAAVPAARQALWMLSESGSTMEAFSPQPGVVGFSSSSPVIHLLDEAGWQSIELSNAMANEMFTDRESLVNRLLRGMMGVNWTQFKMLTADMEWFQQKIMGDSEANTALEDRRGDLWLASGDGVYRFRADRRPPQTRLVRGPAATVGHGTSMLRFEWEGGDRESEPSQLEYAHALVEDAESAERVEWSDWSASTSVEMPAPEGGAYTFLVRARDRVWNEDPTPARHRFRVVPPLWREPWFQATIGSGVLLLLGSLVYAVGQSRRARRDQRLRLEAQEQLNRELEAELQKAHDLQMGLMPAQAPTRPGYDIAGRCRPATHVGGDLFQYFESRQQISLALADVTGHGMEAAVPVLIFNGVLQSEVRHDPPLEELFSVLNNTLYSSLDRRTCVCFAMVSLDLETRRVRLSHSALPFPFHYRARTGRVEEIEMEGAYPLGRVAGTRYGVLERQLEPGDRLVLCSDGIIEVEDGSGALFGFERTAAAIEAGCAEGLGAEALIEFVYGRADRFAAGVEQDDDQTMVVLAVDA